MKSFKYSIAGLSFDTESQQSSSSVPGKTKQIHKATGKKQINSFHKKYLDSSHYYHLDPSYPKYINTSDVKHANTSIYERNPSHQKHVYPPYPQRVDSSHQKYVVPPHPRKVGPTHKNHVDLSHKKYADPPRQKYDNESEKKSDKKIDNQILKKTFQSQTDSKNQSNLEKTEPQCIIIQSSEQIIDQNGDFQIIELEQNGSHPSFSSKEIQSIVQELKNIAPFQVQKAKAYQLMIFGQHIARMSLEIILTIKQSWHNSESGQQNNLKQKIVQSIIKYGQCAAIQVKEEKEDQQNFPTNSYLDILTTAQRHILSYFQWGVYINASYASQQRFENIHSVNLKEINSKNEEIHIEGLTPKLLQSKQFKKLIFCPTSLVTGQIFDEICQPKGRHLISGQYGIGKTYSFLLYKVLSTNIFSYYHLAFSQGQLQRNNWKQFICGNKIALLPKLVYISLNFQEGDAATIAEIRQQFFQIAQRKCLSDKTMKVHQESQKIKQLYKNQFDVNIIIGIDQINLYSSIVKEKYLLQESQQKVSKLMSLLQNKQKQAVQNKQQSTTENRSIKRQISKQQNFIKRILRKRLINTQQQLQIYIQRLIGVLSFSKRNFTRILYLSSINIDSKYVKSSKSDPIWSSKKEISFHRQLACRQFYMDFCSYIQIKIRTHPQRKKLLFIQNITAQDIFNLIKYQNYVPFIPLHIDQLFQQINHQIKLPQLIKQIKKLCIQGMAEHFRDFINKDQPNHQVMSKKTVMLNLVLKAIQMLKNGQENSCTLVVQSPKLPEDFDHILFIHNQEQCTLTININPRFLLDIYNRLKITLYQWLLQVNQPVLRLIRGPVMQGLFYESLIIQCISIAQTKIVLNTQQRINDQWQKVSLSLHFPSSSRFGFQSIPKFGQIRQKNYKFFTSFTRAIPDQWTVFLPVLHKISDFKGPIQDSHIDYSSKCIDFISARNVDETLQIIAVDVTKNSRLISSKIKTFWQAYHRFQDINLKFIDKKTRVKFQYMIILCGNDGESKLSKYSIKRTLKETFENLQDQYSLKQKGMVCSIRHKMKERNLKKISIIQLADIEFNNQSSWQFQMYKKIFQKLRKNDQAGILTE